MYHYPGYGFDGERFFDFNNDGHLDISERAFMLHEQDLECRALFNRSYDSGSFTAEESPEDYGLSLDIPEDREIAVSLGFDLDDFDF